MRDRTYGWSIRERRRVLVQFKWSTSQYLINHLSPLQAVVDGILSTLVGAVTLAEMAPDPATANTILSNARALIKERVRFHFAEK